MLNEKEFSIFLFKTYIQLMKNHQRIWRAFYVRPQHEIKASERLLAQGIEMYCPVIQTRVKWSDRWKKKTKPLISRYVFGFVNEEERLQVLRDDSIVNTVSWLGNLAEIRTDEIEAMKEFLDGKTNVNVTHFKVGKQAEVNNGSLKGQKGIIVRVSDTEILLRLDSLYLQISVKVHPNQLEIDN